jgi:hypothetical protein
MLYITLDTCVWLGLIKIDLHNDNNVFEEICFWIENKHVIHISPENMIREWDRNKAAKLVEITRDIRKFNNTIIEPLRGTSDLISAYQPDAVEDAVSKRIERVDSILKIHSEIASENQTIYDQAVKRNFDCLAPNHSEDSFRDTVNIFTLINYIKAKCYQDCIFSTINYKDFSVEKAKKDVLHPQLVDDFKNANLEYVYCSEENFAGRLLGVYLRPKLPSFQDYLRDKKREEEARTLAAKKSVVTTTGSNSDPDYLENIKYIDIVLAKKQQTDFDKDVVKLLTERHESYKQYFLKNLGNDGMV